MKKIIIVSIILLAGVILIACSNKTKDQNNANLGSGTTAEEEAKANSIAESEYQIFKDKSDITIKENEIKIEKLKQRIASSDKNVQIRLNKRISELEERNQRVKSKLSEYKHTGAAEWNSFKREFEHDMDELGEALKGFSVDDKN